MTDPHAAANAATSRDVAGASVRPARCRDCGSRYVAWVQSTRTGKWYLCDATIGTPGHVIPARHKPHFKSCTGQEN